MLQYKSTRQKGLARLWYDQRLLRSGTSSDSKPIENAIATDPEDR